MGDLAAGGNAFVWTLSSADCPAYSADTVLVFQSEGLAANTDVYFNLGQPLVNLDFLANDKIPNRDAVNWERVMSVEPVWKIQMALRSPCASRVTVPDKKSELLAR